MFALNPIAILNRGEPSQSHFASPQWKHAYYKDKDIEIIIQIYKKFEKPNKSNKFRHALLKTDSYLQSSTSWK